MATSTATPSTPRSCSATRGGSGSADGVLYHYYGVARPWQDVEGSDVVHWNRRGIALATSRPLD